MKGNMDDRTGKFYEGESPDAIAKQFGVPKANLVPVGNLPATACPKCGGKGSRRKGLFSRRYVACECTNPVKFPVKLP